MKQKSVVLKAMELDRVLADTFPVWRTRQPLKLGIVGDIHDWLQQEEKQFSKRAIHYCLRWHTGNPQYLAGMQVGHPRYDLSGKPCGEVSLQECHYAQRFLSEIVNK